MKKLLLTGIAVLLLFLKPAFASHALQALDGLAYIIVGAGVALVLGTVFSIVAFRTNKLVWKILAAPLTVFLLIGAFVVVSLGNVVWLGYAMIALAVVNVLLITNARKRKDVKGKTVATP